MLKIMDDYYVIWFFFCQYYSLYFLLKMYKKYGVFFFNKFPNLKKTWKIILDLILVYFLIYDEKLFEFSLSIVFTIIIMRPNLIF